ncbi:hypothetical protein FLGE108171_16055 [Flavobacterium gelidilacus]
MKVSPSISKSFARTTIVTGFVASVVAVSSTAVTVLSPSTTGNTSIVKVAVSQAGGVTLSQTVYVKTVVPTYPATGVKI